MSESMPNSESNPKRIVFFHSLSVEGPAFWFVHSTAILVQVLFGIGSCIGKEALNKMPSLIFAFYRELFSGLILLAVCVVR